jgi:hypothetical protein
MPALSAASLELLEMARFYAVAIPITVWYTLSTCAMGISLNDKYIQHVGQTGFVGQRVTLACHAADLTQPVNWWYRSSLEAVVIELCVNGELINGNRKRFALDPTKYDLTLLSPKLSDAGTYTCVENSGFDTRHVTQLTVSEPDDNHGNTTVIVGQPVTVQCRSGTDSPVNWLFRGHHGEREIELAVHGQLLNGFAIRFRLRGTNSDLIIPAATLTDTGRYTCVENAGFGRRHTTYIHVKKLEQPDVTIKVKPAGPTTSSDHGGKGSSSDTYESSSSEFYTTLYVIIGLLVLLVVLLICTVACLIAKNRTGERLQPRGNRPSKCVNDETTDRLCHMAVDVEIENNNIQENDATHTLTQRTAKILASAGSVLSDALTQLTVRSSKSETRPSVRAVSFSRQQSTDSQHANKDDRL